MSRKDQSFNIRLKAAALARDRPDVLQTPRGDDTTKKLGSFTKGLPHDKATGILTNPEHYTLFTRAIETGANADLKVIPLGPPDPPGDDFISGISQGDAKTPKADIRAWESMAAGNVFDLQGPDGQSLALPPHPALDSEELVAEMTELYWMALLRDIPFTKFLCSTRVKQAVDDMNATKWILYCRKSLSSAEKDRLRGPFTPRTIFRGVLPGDNVGPYISQFLLCGTPGIDSSGDPRDGFIAYGAHRIDQRVRVAEPGRDYMTTWASWLDAQNGADLRGRERYSPGYRFIATPRDLATYVHFDALYQAYLNACLILLAIKAPFDEGIPFQDDDDIDKQQGFALFGPPHILTLVAEVAIRALKATRFQKFNIHRRPRPEALGGLIERFHHEPHDGEFRPVTALCRGLNRRLLKRVAEHNAEQSQKEDFGNPRYSDYDPFGIIRTDTHLLPMAYPEGSPMHPSYGAGHATVAGACVTILKAWFDTNWELPFAYEANDDGSALVKCPNTTLTLEGELNKVCSNISIGRNWAGVHYFTDYIESIKMGEQIAIGILEEQMLTHKQVFSMTLTKFDGSTHTFTNH